MSTDRDDLLAMFKEQAIQQLANMRGLDARAGIAASKKIQRQNRTLGLL